MDIAAKVAGVAGKLLVSAVLATVVGKGLNTMIDGAKLSMWKSMKKFDIEMAELAAQS